MKLTTIRFIAPLWACVLILCLSCREQQKTPAPESSYKTITVSESSQTLYTDFPATIQGKQDVDIFPQISGLITRICVNEGAEVKQGQTLFVIDQAPYKAALEKAKANVESAEANVATAQMTVESKEQLWRENVVSDFDLQQARNTLRGAKASLSQARAELTTAQTNLSYTEIKSPVSGIAGMSSYRIGALVSPSITTPLITVSDCSEMSVYFSMTEKQILSYSRYNGSLSNAIHTMPQVQIILNDGSEYSSRGKVDAISGMVDASTGTVSLRAKVENPNRILRSGATCTVRIPQEKSGCIVVPQTATYELQDKVFVYKVVNGKTKSTPIKVFEINNGTDYIVESGLTAGDVIIAEGAGLLREGVAVSNSGKNKGK
ncbi:MAG: efflux RND transporter periplasmic adaptor subunit [Sodaliphilus sp.]